MRKNKLLTAFLVIVMTVLFSGIFVTDVLAAAKPSAAKKKVTMTVGDKPYTILLNKVKKNAKITYKSSDKSVVKVNAGTVTAVAKGKATVTVKVKQNKKTYKIKIKFKVKEEKKKTEEKGSETKEPETKESETKESVRSENEKNSILYARAEKYNYDFVTGSQDKVYSTEKEAELGLIEKCKEYSGFNMFIKNLTLLKTEQEYMEMYPTLRALEFERIEVYNNVCYVRVNATLVENFYIDEIAIDFAITHKDTSLLDSDEKKLYNKVTSLAAGLKKANEYDTVKAIHDHIVLNTKYYLNGKDVHRLAGALNDGLCVCDGYSKMFYFLCRACGIDSMIVTGEADNGNASELHAWNKVKINNKWYSLDVTWDDPSPDVDGQVMYSYFLITDTDISRDHFWDNSTYPVADSKDLGIVYAMYEGIKRFTKAQDAYDYVVDQFAQYSNSYHSYGEECSLEFIDETNSDQLYDALLKLCKDYYNYRYYSYSIQGDSAGFYGILYKVRIY